MGRLLARPQGYSMRGLARESFSRGLDDVEDAGASCAVGSRGGALVQPLACVQCGAEQRAEWASRGRGWRSRVPEWSRRWYRRAQRAALLRGRVDVARSQERTEALRARRPGLRIDDMAAVCCYFNPCGYRSRRANYEVFRRAFERSGVPLLTVELAFGDAPFELEQREGEGIRLRSNSVLWQKERLLNVGISRLLERGVSKILWIDADVVFEEAEHWPWHVAAALDRDPMCHGFDQVLIEDRPGRAPVPAISSVKYRRDVGSAIWQERLGPSLRWPLGYPLGVPGYVWAARAEVLRELPLYDAAVLGGGDKLIHAASVEADADWPVLGGKLLSSEVPACRQCGHVRSSAPFVDHFAAWARCWAELIGGRVGVAELTVSTLFHGELRDRDYLGRRDVLLRHDYDPAADVTIGEQGVWEWSSDKTSMHREVESYFLERREDFGLPEGGRARGGVVGTVNATDWQSRTHTKTAELRS